jgi:hypothetical protein
LDTGKFFFCFRGRAAFRHFNLRLNNGINNIHHLFF